ncbi:hypothetical protein DA2_1577 [Desulfovibrio sp. A2]|nr:hypothetical protein DA2_1577 [Desulfovibrio sp. A2]
MPDAHHDPRLGDSAPHPRARGRTNDPTCHIGKNNWFIRS